MQRPPPMTGYATQTHWCSATKPEQTNSLSPDSYQQAGCILTPAMSANHHGRQPGSRQRRHNAIDSNTATIWHTRWPGGSTAPPHWIVINLGTATGGKPARRHLPRQDGGVNGTVARYNVYLSADGVNWGQPVTGGNFSDLGADTARRRSISPTSPAATPAQSSGPLWRACVACRRRQHRRRLWQRFP